MRHLHYLEIRNFKGFGDRTRIELDHPAVLVGPNNCGKTTALQAIALWSQAVRTWFDRKGQAPPKERTATGLNRLGVVAVPVRSTRDYWHNMVVRTGNENIPLEITLGVLHDNRVKPVTMRFRCHGDELVYCTPDESTLNMPAFIEAAGRLNVRLLYPMSGIETEEPIIQPGRMDVLLGQGQTAQVLRNLCLMVFREDRAAWSRIEKLMKRLFDVGLEDPSETGRGAIDLFYHQPEVRRPLDIALAGRGLQQMLLILAYLHSHPRSVLLIDEPDAHLEILRQRQAYVLLRDVAERNDSQVVLVTHSEVILGEALDRNLTLLLGGHADELASRADIVTALRHYGADHYIRARQQGYVLYVEGGTDLAALQALARKVGHPAADAWDERANVFYVQDNYPEPDPNSALERVEGGFGVTPRQHFFALRPMLPELRGLAILDGNARQREDADEGGLNTTYWRRYEIENYIVTPEVLRACTAHAYRDLPLFDRFRRETDEVLDGLTLDRVFDGRERDFLTWKGMDPDAARLLWEARTERLKLSDFAEEFFRRLADKLGHAMLLRKRDLHRLVDFMDAEAIAEEVSEKLGLLAELFAGTSGSDQSPLDRQRKRNNRPLAFQVEAVPPSSFPQPANRYHAMPGTSSVVRSHTPSAYSGRDPPSTLLGLRLGLRRDRRDRSQYRRSAVGAGGNMAGGRGSEDRERNERGSRSVRGHLLLRCRCVGPDLRPRRSRAGGPHFQLRRHLRSHGREERRGTGGVHPGRFDRPLPERRNLGDGNG